MPPSHITDSHVHLWNPEHIPMPWLRDATTLDRVFGADEYRAQSAGLPITGMVYVEVGVAPQFALVEAIMAVAMSRQEPRLRGIVAAAPLEYGDRSRAYLDVLKTLGPIIKGVRRNVQDELDPAFCLRPDFVGGVRLLPEYGYSCDVCIRHHQLAATIELVRQCPDVQFILDHLGKPDIAGKSLDPWRSQLDQLASFPNVWCKLSGLVTEADFKRWQVEDIRPYADYALAAFGDHRVMFGGDWPVVLQAATYSRWVETVQELVGHLSPESQQRIWHLNAHHCYRLDR